ncbi:Zinc finger protein CONSTANS-LIKE 4 [Glycine soja]
MRFLHRLKRAFKDGCHLSLNLTSLKAKTFDDDSIKSVLEKRCLLKRWLVKHRLRKENPTPTGDSKNKRLAAIEIEIILVHATNKLESRHPRVALCELREQALAHVTSKADAAALCLACDRDIHSANRLASCHECIPITLLFESEHSVKASSPINFHHRFFSDIDADANVSIEEAEVASWLLANPKTDLNSSQYLFSETKLVPYIDLDYAAMDPKTEQNSSATTDDVVLMQSNFKSFTYEHQTSFFTATSLNL